MNPRKLRLTIRVAIPLSVALTVACRGGPEPLTLPEWKPEVTCFAGTPLVMATAESAVALRFEPDHALLATIAIRWFETLPDEREGLSPLNDRIERIIDLKDAGALLPSLGMTENAWVATGDAAAQVTERFAAEPRSAELENTSTVLPGGVTLKVTNIKSAATAVPRVGATTSSIEISHIDPSKSKDGSSKVRLTVVFEGYVPTESVSTPDALVLRREVVLLRDTLPTDGSPLAVLFTPRNAEVRGAYLITVSARPALNADSTADDRAALEDQLAKCAQACYDASPAGEFGSRPDPFAEIAGLERDYRRGAIARLAIVNGAAAAADLAMVADDEAIDVFAGRLQTARKDAKEPIADLPLELERETWKYLADRMSGTDFPLALAAICVRHAGEAGRFAAVLEDAAASARSLADLELRFVAENRSLLEDRSPSSRARAFEWLRRRGIEIEGFDPGGPLADRKKALRAAEDKEAAAAVGASK